MKNIFVEKTKRLVIFFFSLFLLIGAWLSVQPAVVLADNMAGTPNNLTAKAGPHRGEVMLNWSPATNTVKYTLVYGLSSGNYMFGSLSVDGGPTPNYLVTELAPGTKYFFQTWAFQDPNGPATPSQEVSFTAP